MFKNILVPIHLDYKANHKKLFLGAQEVLLDEKDSKMTLLYVNENRAHGSVYNHLDGKKETNSDNEALTKLKEIAKNFELPEDRVSFRIKEGTVHTEILEEAKKIDADAIVMMATRPGLGSYFISSTAERVIRHAKCSVFVIRRDPGE
ncbi:MAG: universal stress protein [Arcobacteraceae bacterium]